MSQNDYLAKLARTYLNGDDPENYTESQDGQEKSAFVPTMGGQGGQQPSGPGMAPQMGPGAAGGGMGPAGPQMGGGPPMAPPGAGAGGGGMPQGPPPQGGGGMPQGGGGIPLEALAALGQGQPGGGMQGQPGMEGEEAEGPPEEGQMQGMDFESQVEAVLRKHGLLDGGDGEEGGSGDAKPSSGKKEEGGGSSDQSGQDGQDVSAMLQQIMEHLNIPTGQPDQGTQTQSQGEQPIQQPEPPKGMGPGTSGGTSQMEIGAMPSQPMTMPQGSPKQASYHEPVESEYRDHPGQSKQAYDVSQGGEQARKVRINNAISKIKGSG